MSVCLETEAGDQLTIQGSCSFRHDLANTFVLPGNLVP